MAGLREEECQQHKLAVLLAAEEQPPQRQVAIRALQDAVVVPAGRTVEVPLQPTAPPRVVGEDVVGQVGVEVALKGRLRHRLAVDRDVEALARPRRIGVDPDGVLAAHVLQLVREAGRTAQLQLAEDLDDRLDQVRLARAVAADQHRRWLRFVEVDLE